MRYLNEWRAEIRRFIIEQTNQFVSSPKQVLEVGCGQSNELVAAEYNVQVHTLDTHKQHGTPTFIADICNKCSLEKHKLWNTYDVIYCIEVLEHCKFPWLAADNLKNILTSNGKLFVSVPTALDYHGEPPNFGDYWRFLPEHVECLFTGLSKIYLKEFKVEKTLVGLSYCLEKKNT
jgi:2-polyprenyl-3-methyl-5-hydroxy-6-metoxy-1,4-benzoquinol methylase